MNPILRHLPLTRIKLFFARVLYHAVKLFFGTEKRIIKRHGLYFEVDISEGLDLSLFLLGGFQKHVSNNKYISLDEDDVIFDVGANVGIMTLYFAQKVKKGKVFAFEPTHYAYQKLERNIAINPKLKENIQTVQAFFTSKEKKRSEIHAFSSWKIDKGIASEQHQVHGGTAMSIEGVPVTTLDEFVKKHRINRLDFIKIDTDGHEFDILTGAEKTVKQLRPKIIFELGQYVMDEKGITFMDYLHYFNRLKYTLSDASSNKSITAGNFEKMIPTKSTIDILAVPM